MKVRHWMLAATLAAIGVGAQAQSQERIIRFGHVVQPGHPISLGVQKFAEIVSAKELAELVVARYREGRCHRCGPRRGPAG